MEARRHEVRPRGEEPVGRSARVLEAAGGVAHAEAHLRGLRGHAEPREEPLEGRVVAVVEDDEAGVHVVGLVGGVHADRVRVAARLAARLEHRDLVVLAVEQVGGNETRDPGADDGDPHGSSPVRRSHSAQS